MEPIIIFFKQYWQWATGILATLLVGAFFSRALMFRSMSNSPKQRVSGGSIAAGGNVTAVSQSGNAVISTGGTSSLFADRTQIVLALVTLLVVAFLIIILIRAAFTSTHSVRNGSISSQGNVTSQSKSGNALVSAGSNNVITQNVFSGDLGEDFYQKVTDEVMSRLSSGTTPGQRQAVTNELAENISGTQATEDKGGSSEVEVPQNRVKELADKILNELKSSSEEFGPDQYAEYLEDAATKATSILEQSIYANDEERLSLAGLWASIAWVRSGDASAKGLMRAYWNALYLIPSKSGLAGAKLARSVSDDMMIVVHSYGDSIRFSHISLTEAIMLREMALRRELQILDSTLGPYDPALVEVLCRNASFYYHIDTPHLGNLMSERVLRIFEKQGHDFASAKLQLVESLASGSDGKPFSSDEFLISGVARGARHIWKETLSPQQRKKLADESWD